MVYKSENDQRCAIPSWSGYIYQGQIAIVVVLEKIKKIRVSHGDISRYAISLENIEDFSIYCDENVESIHQVKATKETNLSNYHEALYYMAKNLLKASNINNAYLHTAYELSYNNWQEDLLQAIQQNNDRLQRIIQNDALLDNMVSQLQSKLTGNFKIDRRISCEQYEILSRIEIKSKSDINADSVRKAIQEYINNYDITDPANSGVLSKIHIYNYSDHSTYVPITSVDDKIESLIQELWGPEEASLKSNVNQYRQILQQIIDENVRERHVDLNSSVRIPFKNFWESLNGPLPTNGEQRLLDQKDILFNERQIFCRDNCPSAFCTNCDLTEKMLLISTMKSVELKKFLYMLSPHISNNIADTATNLLSEEGLASCTFCSLQQLEKSQYCDYKLVYSLNGKQYLLTDIYISKNRQKEIFRNILKNSTVEQVCESISQNREFGPKCMEIDSLVVSDICNNCVTDIFEEAHKLGLDQVEENDKEKNKEYSYMKITHKKKVSMTNVTDFIASMEAK